MCTPSIDPFLIAIKISLKKFRFYLKTFYFSKTREENNARIKLRSHYKEVTAWNYFRYPSIVMWYKTVLLRKLLPKKVVWARNINVHILQTHIIRGRLKCFLSFLLKTTYFTSRKNLFQAHLVSSPTQETQKPRWNVRHWGSCRCSAQYSWVEDHYQIKRLWVECCLRRCNLSKSPFRKSSSYRCIWQIQQHKIEYHPLKWLQKWNSWQ